MERLRFGLIGSGRIGQVHAASVAAHPELELAWIADPMLDGARSVAVRFGGRATDDVDDLFADEALDAVVVASPTPTHVGLIERCIDAGIPVLCEKPIDLDIAKVDALHDKVARLGVPVAIGFNQRFDPAVAEVHRRVGDGEIGAIEHLTLVSRDPGPPPADYIAVSGGMFRDMTIHDFDTARFFLGDIASVSAVGAQVFDDGAREHGDFDSVVVTLQATSGAIASIVNARHSAIGYDQRLEAFGAKGLLQVSNAPSSLVSASTADGVEVRGRYVEPFIERYAAAYRAELAEFVGLVRGEESSNPTFEDGRAALLVADAAERSAREGRAIALAG